MSRVGKSPVLVPNGVQVEIANDEVTIKGKLGELKMPIASEVKVTYEDAKPDESAEGGDALAQLVVEAVNDSTFSRAMWGTVRSNLNNMVKGVSEGFEIRLEIKGVGFRAQSNDKLLTLFLGFSHEIKYAIPPEINIKCEKQTTIVISGADKQKIGQVAGEIISYRPVEPYKGKGVYIEGTQIRRKEGKKK